MPSLKTGIYQHYKGKHCKVLGLAKHSETGEVLVIYQNCEVSDEEIPLRARPYKPFFGTIEQNGKEIPRFVYQGNKPEK
ncbi:MAG: DUF1653 domain-containing protein [candidate division SR1 bacterium]|nr:MAG: DUF1653 domain-containing protein [candidate division SR1 bacterium]